jgi:ribose-phosphate pyrophosphokinase
MRLESLVIVGSIADNPFVADIAQHLYQEMHYSDLISLKSFLNDEFCPRFIIDDASLGNVGNKLKGKTVLTVSTSNITFSRDDLAMRNFLIARAAKDNGADRVLLLEPDLFYSAQDRGPRPEHGFTDFERDLKDFKKFDGQPFSSRLYADLLKESGVDEVITVHNHSNSVKRLFMDRFSGAFHNLQPADVFATYMRDSDIVDADNLILCAPDKGALPFVKEVHGEFGRGSVPVLTMTKERTGEREIEMSVNTVDSDVGLADVKGKHVVVIDDMVRTGNTIVNACRILRHAGAARVVFFVTHFYSSREGRVILNDPAIDEIVTTSTIPQILNRDMQGRLRHKMVVLRIARWVSNFIWHEILEQTPLPEPLYHEDMSSKNPRWKGNYGPLFGRA